MYQEEQECQFPHCYFTLVRKYAECSHFYEGRWWGSWILRREILWRPQSQRGPGADSCPGNAFPETRRSACGFSVCWFVLLTPHRARAVKSAPTTNESPGKNNKKTNKKLIQSYFYNLLLHDFIDGAQGEQTSLHSGTCWIQQVPEMYFQVLEAKCDFESHLVLYKPNVIGL